MRAVLLASILAISTPVSVTAQTAAPVAEQGVSEPSVSPEVEDRARALGRTLRCVVCQNQSIEESDADLAADMRQLVRQELSGGSTEAEVTALMRDRYGDYVLLKPPVQRNTLVLWFAPLLAAGFGLIWFVSLRRRKQTLPVDELSADERARLEMLRQ